MSSSSSAIAERGSNNNEYESGSVRRVLTAEPLFNELETQFFE